jgi:DNA-binding transcriptional LysR family regulator
VAPTLPAFLQQYPEIRLELDLGDRVANLAQEGFDLAIRHTQAPPETHVAWTLCASRSLLVASPATCGGTASRASAELAAHACLLYLRAARARAGRSSGAAGAGRSRAIVNVDGPLRANNSEVLREAVLGGLGIGLLPDFSAAAHLGPRQLVAVLPQWRPLGFFGDGIYAIRPWSPQVPRAVQCFVDHLKAVFAQGFV